MSNNSYSLDGARQFVKKFMFNKRYSDEGQESLIINLDDSPQQIFERLIKNSYSFADSMHAATASTTLEMDDDGLSGISGEYYYIQPTYTPQQLAMIEDAWRNDAVFNNGISKFVFGIMGKHGRTVLDTALEFNNEQKRRDAIKQVQDNAGYTDAKTEVDKRLTSSEVDFFTTFTEMVEEWLVFGRSASYMIKDENGLLDSLIHLDPKRLGRVRVIKSFDKNNLKIDAVEYLDCIVDPETGKTAIGLQSDANSKGAEQTKPAFIPISDLLYLPYSQGSIVTNSKYAGWSKFEAIIHISQVKRIILNEMLKEASKALYAGFGLVKVPPDLDDNFLATFIYNVKRSVGRWFGYKIEAVFDIKDLKPAIEKYVTVVDLINREILRCIGLASFLVGYEQIANYANSEQIMLATREMDITHLRTRLRDFIKHKLLDPLFVYFILNGINQTNPTGQRIIANQLAINERRFADVVDIPKEDLDAYNQQVLETKNVKLVYEFAEVNFSTKLELAQMFDIVKRLVPKLPSEAILRNLGLDDYIEEVTNAEAEEAKRQDSLSAAKLAAYQAGANGNGAGATAAGLNSIDRMMASAVGSSGDPKIKSLFEEYLKAGIAMRKKAIESRT